MDRIDCIVIGAGVVGLAVARALAISGREVVILEKERAIGTGVSSRSSEVIHAGLYYPEGSLKARLCVEGSDLLYRYCEDHGIAHRRCGKLVVATDATQYCELELLLRSASNSGARDLAILSATQARQIEPALSCEGALWSPRTGIVDSHSLMHSLLGDAQRHGAMLALESPFRSAQSMPDKLILSTGGSEPATIEARWIINSAGLFAQDIARSISGMPVGAIPAQQRAKGSYFTLKTRSPFSHLIYPIPQPGGLGVHLTLDLAGRARFGPDVEWLDTFDDTSRDYWVDPQRSDAFYRAIRLYWPALPDQGIEPGYAGIRPKLASSSGTSPDFVIQGEIDHGVPGLINLFGIESPGLTSCLAIAEWIAQMVGDD